MQLQHEICTIEGCGRPHKARGYCQTHYMQFKRGAPVVAEIRTRNRNVPDVCVEDGCENTDIAAKGLCHMHYARLLRHGHTRNLGRTKDPKTCRIDGCDNWSITHGMCSAHYQKSRKWIGFGMSIEQYFEKLEKQKGVCEICKEKETATDGLSLKIRAMPVDHDHETGKVRGIICTRCNRGLGLFKDDADIMLEAVAYLNRYKSSG